MPLCWWPIFVCVHNYWRWLLNIQIQHTKWQNGEKKKSRWKSYQNVSYASVEWSINNWTDNQRTDKDIYRQYPVTAKKNPICQMTIEQHKQIVEHTVNRYTRHETKYRTHEKRTAKFVWVSKVGGLCAANDGITRLNGEKGNWRRRIGGTCVEQKKPKLLLGLSSVKILRA